MNADIAKKWVEALRSGKYTQTRGRLHTPEGFCCLGVLCDILKEEVTGSWELKTGDELPSFKFVPTAQAWSPPEHCALPISMRKHTGIKTAWASFTTDYGETQSLAGMNDQGVGFEEIAHTIEKYAEVL